MGMRNFMINKPGHPDITIKRLGSMSTKFFQAAGWDKKEVLCTPHTLLMKTNLTFTGGVYEGCSVSYKTTNTGRVTGRN
jgi:hypothetical protein